MKVVTCIFLLMALPLAYAADPPTEEELEGAEQEVLDVGEEPLELEKYTVTGIQFTLEQETALRMVRQALTERKSYKREDKDTWVCWYRKPAGSHFNYLECARNGDLQALKPDRMFGNLVTGGAGYAGYGTIMRSQRPVNKKKFEAMLDTLPGSGDLDREFVAMSMAGMETPRDIPSKDELDQFVEAYKSVKALEVSGGDDLEMASAIESEGLTIRRYNRMVDLVETYQSLENEVAFRLGTLERPHD
jgi:hypothetical protein